MKTNFAAYIQSQKMRVRAESEGDIDFIAPDGQTCTLSGQVRLVRDSGEIFDEIDALHGLNTAERASSARISRADRFGFSVA